MELIIQDHEFRQASHDRARIIKCHRHTARSIAILQDDPDTRIIECSNGRELISEVTADWLHVFNDGKKNDLGVDWGTVGVGEGEAD